MSNPYLDQTLLGKNQWWRYLISLPLILVCWQVIGALPVVALVFAVMLDGNANTYLGEQGQFHGIPPILPFVFTLLSFFGLVIGLFLAVRLVHGRRFITLITPAGRIDWKRVGVGFGAWTILAALVSLLEALLYPGRYRLDFDPLAWSLFLVAGVLLIPIQTSAEELFMRGYMLQSLGLKLHNRLLLSAISGVLFALPHFANPEVSVNFWLLMSFYAAIGAFFAWITLRDQKLELALGAHAANNLFSALFTNYPNSALPTPAMFMVDTLDPVYSLVSVLLIMPVFVWLVFRAAR